MNFSINEVDQVIERTGCTYEEAKEVLTKADGNVLDAIIIWEEKNKTIFDRMKDLFADGERNSEAVVGKIREIIAEGNASRIAVRDKDDKQLVSVPLTVGAAGGALALVAGAAPLVIVSGLVAKFGMDCKFVITKSDGSEIVV